jgi:hypothetical protein
MVMGLTSVNSSSYLAIELLLEASTGESGHEISLPAAEPPRYSPALMKLSLKALEEALGIRRQIETLEARLAALFGTSSGAPQSTSPNGPRRRSMSPAARARIAAAQRARWAKRKAGSTAKAKAPQPKRGGGLTAAGRKRLSDLMKARWAARRGKGVPNRPK